MTPGQSLRLEFDQRYALGRFSALELNQYFHEVLNNPQDERKNWGLWMEAIGAKPLRQERHSTGLLGTLWELPCGQFFWTSQNGQAWNFTPKLN